jgi:hypothetical protein
VARLRDLVVDCAHPAALARFWAAVLDGYEVAPYDDAELARLRSAGITDTEDDPTVLVQPTQRSGQHGPAGPRLWFQLVPERKRVKNRLHPDLVADDPGAEIDRLTGLGATVRERHPDNVVLSDPEGNEFCLMS